MSEQTFQVIVNGTLTEGAQLDQVKQNIAKLFNTSVGKVEPMFSGRKMAVKKGLDQQTAQKYKAAIIKAGLAAGIAPMAPATQPQPTEQPATAGQSGVSLDNASIAAVGSVMDETPPPAEPDIDISNLDMGSPGETLSQQNQPPEPDIDVSDLTMGEVGEDVTEHKPAPEPDIDISDLSMGEVGEDVMEYEEVPPLDVDISELSMGEVGEDVMEHEAVPPVNIDTSKLSLDEPGK